MAKTNLCKQHSFSKKVSFVAVSLGLNLALGLQAFAGALTDKGTQPVLQERLDEPAQCATCHGNYDIDNHIEPYPTWSGNMMAQAGRDHLFWASLDVANNDIADVGDFCLRCHTPRGWLEGRSEAPGGTTDGCAMLGKIDQAGEDFSGVNCDFCHRMMVNDAPPLGEQTVYTENGQFWIDDTPCDTDQPPCGRGPYEYAGTTHNEPTHGWLFSAYHTESVICGNCHNVTNPALNLIDNGMDVGILFPIERTYAEWLSSEFSNSSSSSFATCQDCHMPDAGVDPAYASAFKDNNRTGEMPIHELVGGNSWMPEVIRQEYPALDRDDSLEAAAEAAVNMLESAASIELESPPSVSAGGSVALNVKVTNLTGHKLPTGYPEGRRMWVQVEVRDAGESVVFESGAYDSESGVLTNDEQLKIYQSKQGIWDHNGTGECDVEDSAGKPLFHFVLNNCIKSDNRIPPLGFVGKDDDQVKPVGYDYPETANGSGILVNFDETNYSFTVTANTVGPLSVAAQLLYQTTSKEYVSFLKDEAEEHSFPADCIQTSSGAVNKSRGALLYDMWEEYGRSKPVTMTSATAQIDIASMPDNGSVSDGDDGCGCVSAGAIKSSGSLAEFVWFLL